MRAVQTIAQILLIYLFSEMGWAQAPVLQLQSISQTRITNPTFNEFLLSATPPADPALSTGNETFIPQVVDGGGY